jgi:hypothetical protein
MYFAKGERPSIEKLAEKIFIEGEGDCWIWKGSIANTGYGIIQVYKGWNRDKGRSEYKIFSLHRLTYEMFKGPIPDGLVVNHLCEIRSCCNPLHLEVCTIGENVRYSKNFRGGAPIQPRCKRGHPMKGKNLIHSGKRRACRMCQRRYEREYSERQKHRV